MMATFLHSMNDNKAEKEFQSMLKGTNEKKKKTFLDITFKMYPV